MLNYNLSRDLAARFFLVLFGLLRHGKHDEQVLMMIVERCRKYVVKRKIESFAGTVLSLQIGIYRRPVAFRG